MDVIDAIKNRRSIRAYQDKDIADDVINNILECGRLAASAGNRQPWVFYVVKDRELKNRLVIASGGQSFIGQAPVVIVICGDPEESATRYEDRGRTLYFIQDTASAMTNMILAAVNYGLGTCWVGAFSETKVRDALSIPANLRPVAMLPIGYPAEDPKPRRRKEAGEVIKHV